MYAAAVSISGPLNLKVANCPGARGKRILAIHGAEDQNVPIAGGRGMGLARVDYRSEKETEQIFTTSGADFRLQIVAGAEHNLDTINSRMKQTEGVSIAERAAHFFGLAK